MVETVEVLYCIASSADRKGKRVLIREGGVENTLWSEDDIQDVDLKLLGVTEQDQRDIQQFFQSDRSED